MGGKILFIFILVIVLGVLLYVYNAGFVGRGINFLKTIAPLSSTSTPPQVTPPQTPSYTAYTAPTSGTVIAPMPTATPPTPPTGFTASQLSPYYGQVRFGGVSAGCAPYTYGGCYGEITFYANSPSQTSTIDVTGWQIKANYGGEYIPQAVNIYDPLGLTSLSDINLKSGDMLIMYSTSAPVNLRLNECIGYLPNKSQFSPELPQTCPYVDQSAAIQSFSGACQNYIMSLGSCQSPDLSNPEIPINDYACRTYLENNFNYRACFYAHLGDANFLSNQVWVWMGSSPVGQYHDRVLLLDREGLLVDIYTY